MPRIVIDTSVLISRFIRPQSIPAMAVKRAMDLCTILLSTEMFEELSEAINRPKFKLYFDAADLKKFIEEYYEMAEKIPVTTVIRACRDPEDDKVLELAVGGAAQIIVSSDKDLLDMHPFRGIEIITPQQFIDIA